MVVGCSQWRGGADASSDIALNRTHRTPHFWLPCMGMGCMYVFGHRTCATMRWQRAPASIPQFVSDSRCSVALLVCNMPDEDSIAGDSDVPSHSAVVKRRRAAVVQGPLKIIAVSACASEAFWCEVKEGTVPPTWAQSAQSGGLLVGFLCVVSWKLAKAGDETSDPGLALMRQRCLKHTRGACLYGFVEYPVVAWAKLKDPVATPPHTVATTVRLMENRIVELRGSVGVAGPTLAEVICEWRSLGATMGCAIRLGQHVAHLLLTGAWSCMHCVAITGKVARKRLVDPQKPSRSHLKRFVDECQGVTTEAMSTTSRAVLPRAVNRGWSFGMYEPGLVLDWLEASRFVKDVRRMGDATEAFARIFAGSAKVDHLRMLGDIRMVHSEVLRRARVRLDCVTMLLFRQLWASLVEAVGDGAVSIYMFADASPQWRGLELYAGSFDLFDGKVIQRRLFPMISLDRSFQDAAGKSLALLWQIYLMTGPSFNMVRLFCSRVRSITTDQGVERFLADFPCVLKDFYELVDMKYEVPGKADEAEWLFPRALAVPGWMHLWDLLIRRGLSDLGFFPLWLQGLKAIVSFLRQRQHMAVVARDFRRRGLGGAASVLESARFPNFAEWRWGTLLKCCDALSGILDTLREHFDAQLFHESRDRTGISNMLTALNSGQWKDQFCFVHWLCKWLGGIMQWGRGCACHEKALRAGADIACDKKGRRLNEAFKFATHELQRGLEEANAWGPKSTSSGGSFWLECQAAVRATFELGTRKIKFLDKVPYLLARLAEPGVRQRCLDQWESCDPAGHHRVTVEFLSPAGALRRHIDAMNDDGTGMAPELVREVESLLCIPLDDSAAESPHAVANRLMMHSRGATWPWVAASMRLEQNLQDARLVPDAIDTSYEQHWAAYTNVLRKPSHRSRSQVKKANMKTVQSDVYFMNFAHDRAGTARLGLGHASGEGGRLSDGAYCLSNDKPREELDTKAEHARMRRRARRDGGGDDQAPGLASGSAGGSSGRPSVFRKKTSDEMRLARQFLSAVLKAQSFVSVPVQNEEGESVSQFFQILAVDSKAILINTFMAPGDEDQGDLLFSASVQPLERWRPTCVKLSADSPAQEVFVYHEPCTVDILQICGGLKNRGEWLRWEARQSDVDGCVSLIAPRQLTPDMELSAPTIPVVCLLDALRAQGFSEVARKVLHSSATDKVFDIRSISSKRKYLQCVLASAELLPKVKEFPSGEPGGFYALMLHTQEPVTPGLGEKMYQKLLAEATGDADALRALQVEPAAPSKQLRLAPQRAVAQERDDNSIAGDDDEAEPEGGQPPSQALARGEDDIAGSDDDVVGEVAMPLSGAELPDTLLGQRLRRVRGRRDGKWSYENRISVECSNPLHDRCSKSRSLALDAARFGPLAGVFFLGAWLSKSEEMPQAAHKRYVPTRAEVQAFAESYASG